MVDQNDDVKYIVLVNDEQQYSLWQAHLDIPGGWNKVEIPVTTKEECLAYIKEVWTDMRPLSLRREMDKYKDN